MCVGMGSFSDPSEAQGLAHFLGLFSRLFFLLFFSISSRTCFADFQNTRSEVNKFETVKESLLKLAQPFEG